MRKQQQAEHGKADLEQVIESEENERVRLKNKIIEIEQRIKATKQRIVERAEVDKKKREEELKFLTF